MNEKRGDLVEPWGVEPQTFSLRTRGLVGLRMCKNPINNGKIAYFKL